MSVKKLVDRVIAISFIKDILINTSGTYLNVIFTAIYSIVLVRVFEPYQYGIFVVLITISYLLANILDFGIAATIYSYLPPLISDKKEMYRFLKTNFIFQITLALSSLVLIFLFINPIDNYFLKLNSSKYLYFIALVSVPFYIGQNFCINSLVAAKKIIEVNIASNLANLLKLLLLLLFIYLGKINLEIALILLGIIGPLLFFALILKEFNQIIVKVVKARIQKTSLKKNYTFMFFLSTQIFNLAARVDLFVITYFLTKTDVGYYGLAQKIILSILASVTSITQIFSPEFAKAQNQQKINDLIKKVLFFMMIPIMVFLAAVITPNQIYWLIFTQKYSTVAPITKALSLAHIFYALGAAISLFVLYTIRKPVYILIANLILLIIIFSGSVILVPIIGVLGPSYSIFIAYLAAFLYLLFIYIKNIKKIPK